MALTIRDVAREAGVSTATVSRALRGLGNVDPATAAHVRRVADRMDYVVSVPASRLASGRSESVAVLTPSISRWYFATLLTGIERVMQEASIDLLLHRVSDPSLSIPAVSDRRLRSRVDGVLVLALPANSSDVVALQRGTMPVTLIGSRLAGLSSVTIDDAEGARVATQHLVNLGHRRIGLIGGAPTDAAFVPEISRQDGYLEVLQEAGLQHEARVRVRGYFTTAGGEAAMNTLLALRRPPTAVFALSDEMAFGALRALRRHGLRPGPDVAVVGFDGHDMADFLDLTTISQPVEELGEAGARDLLARLAHPDLEAADRILPTLLQVRGSTTP